MRVTKGGISTFVVGINASTGNMAVDNDDGVFCSTADRCMSSNCRMNMNTKRTKATQS